MADLVKSLRRDRAAVRVFPPAVPLVAILGGMALNRAYPLGGGIPITAPLRYWAGGTILLLAIAGLGASAIREFRRGGQDPNPWKPTPRIETGGPYRWTRNPMYLQLLIVCVGVSILLANWWILLLTPVAGWTLQHLAIRPEEDYLEAKFGEEYLAYKRRVRRWL